MPEHSPDLSKQVFVTGGSGFVGSAIIGALLARGWRVRALVRRSPINRAGVESVRGDLFDTAALEQAMRGCDAVIHLIGIIRETPATGQTFARVHVEGAKCVIDAAKRAGVPRFIHMSALGARPDSASDYARTKAQAESHLRASGLAYTIFRPSVIHGPHGEFMRMVADWANGKAMPYLFMPYFGAGLLGQTSRLLQPVFIDDVARAFADAVEREDLVGSTIELVGSQRMTWPRLYAIVAATLGRRRPRMGIPIWYAKALTRVLPASWLPFNRSQVVMASEDNVADVDVAERALGWRPRGFEETFRPTASVMTNGVSEQL